MDQRFSNPDYPRWLYAAGGRAVEVRTREEHAARYGDGSWYDSPAFIPMPEPAAAQAPSAPDGVVHGGVPSVPPAVEAAVAEATAKLTKFYTLPAKLIIESVGKLETLEDLMDIRRVEEERPGGARVTVLRAVLGRMETLAPVPDAPPEPSDEIAALLGKEHLG